MAALETIKLLAGAGDPLSGRLLLYDGLAGTARTATVAPDPGCPACGRSGPG
jgi:bacteriocin biosynthesis cyclodehydratase domain-containing protein